MNRNKVENKEQEVLRAAEKEFLAKGYTGARTVAIASAAGVTHAMLHYYFNTKEELFGRVLKQKMSLLAEMMEPLIGNAGLDNEEWLRAVVGRHFEFMLANPQLPRFLLNTLTEQPQLIAQLLPRMSAVLEVVEKRFGPEGGQLFEDIITLDMAASMALPLVQEAMPTMTADDYLERRKEETIRLLLGRMAHLGKEPQSTAEPME